MPRGKHHHQPSGDYMLKVADSTYYFIKFIRDNPGCTARDIHEHLFKQLDMQDKRFKDKWVYRYDNNGRYIGHKIIPSGGGYDSSKFSYLTSTYFSNMLVAGGRTKRRSWVRRFRRSEDSCYRFILTQQGLVASGSLTRK